MSEAGPHLATVYRYGRGRSGGIVRHAAAVRRASGAGPGRRVAGGANRREKKPGCFHRLDLAMGDPAQARVQRRARRSPAVGAAAAKAQAAHAKLHRFVVPMHDSASGPCVPRSDSGCMHRHRSVEARNTGEYREDSGRILGMAWQERRDSNPRPSVLETDALPTELRSCRRARLYP